MRIGEALLIVLCVAYATATVRAAWVCDDAYITFRTIDNLLHGHGLTWNPPERVQAYTHPLWMIVLALAHAVTKEPFYTTIALSLAASFAAIWILAFRISATTRGAVLGVAVLTLSGAFIDYSTSGLENPLTHLLLAAFLAIYFGSQTWSARSFLLASFTASLGILNRMDTALLYAPPLAYAFAQVAPRTRAIRALTIGLLPVVAWELFSLVYYGFPLPNTAYAKLNTGIPLGDLAVQGGRYFLDSLRFDPVTLLAIAAGMAIGCCSRPRRSAPVALGILLYLVYILRIGGDFMSGRFFAAPLFSALAIITRRPAMTRRQFGSALVLAVIVALVPRILGDQEGRAKVGTAGITDERLYYGDDGALFRSATGERGGLDATRGRALRASGPSFIVEGAIGVLGYHAGPDTYILDVLALGDPLLARLPALRFDPTLALVDPRRENWRIGHFLRAIPQGYVEALTTGENRLRDPELAAYYELLSLVTRGKLLSLERMAAIVRVNTGGLRVDDPRPYRDPVRMTLAQLAAATRPRTGREERRLVSISFNGLEVALPRRSSAPALGIRLGNNHAYLVVYYREGAILTAQPIVPRGPGSAPVLDYRVNVPERGTSIGYDTIGIFPLRGDGRFVVGGLALLDPRADHDPGRSAPGSP